MGVVKHIYNDEIARQLFGGAIFYFTLSLSLSLSPSRA